MPTLTNGLWHNENLDKFSLSNDTYLAQVKKCDDGNMLLNGTIKTQKNLMTRPEDVEKFSLLGGEYVRYGSRRLYERVYILEIITDSKIINLIKSRLGE